MNAVYEVNQLKKQTKALRTKRYGKSRLDRYEKILLALKNSGASVAEMQRWLHSKRIKVVWTTVYRWLQKNG